MVRRSGVLVICPVFEQRWREFFGIFLGGAMRSVSGGGLCGAEPLWFEAQFSFYGVGFSPVSRDRF